MIRSWRSSSNSFCFDIMIRFFFFFFKINKNKNHLFLCLWKTSRVYEGSIYFFYYFNHIIDTISKQLFVASNVSQVIARLTRASHASISILFFSNQIISLYPYIYIYIFRSRTHTYTHTCKKASYHTSYHIYIHLNILHAYVNIP